MGPTMPPPAVPCEAETDRRLKNVLITLYWLGRAAQTSRDYQGPALGLRAFDGVLSGSGAHGKMLRVTMRATVILSPCGRRRRRRARGGAGGWRGGGRDSGYLESCDSERSASLSPPSHVRDDSLDSLDSLGSLGSAGSRPLSPDAPRDGGEGYQGSDAESEGAVRRRASGRDDMSLRRVSTAVEPKTPPAAFNQFLPGRHQATAPATSALVVSAHLPAPLRRKRGERNEVARRSWASSVALQGPDDTDGAGRSLSVTSDGGLYREQSESTEVDPDGTKSLTDVAGEGAARSSILLHYEELQKIRGEGKEQEEQWQDDLARWKNRRRSTSGSLKRLSTASEAEGPATAAREIRTYAQMMHNREDRERDRENGYGDRLHGTDDVFSSPHDGVDSSVRSSSSSGRAPSSGLADPPAALRPAARASPEPPVAPPRRIVAEKELPPPPAPRDSSDDDSDGDAAPPGPVGPPRAPLARGPEVPRPEEPAPPRPVANAAAASPGVFASEDASFEKRPLRPIRVSEKKIVHESVSAALYSSMPGPVAQADDDGGRAAEPSSVTSVGAGAARRGPAAGPQPWSAGVAQRVVGVRPGVQGVRVLPGTGPRPFSAAPRSLQSLPRTYQAENLFKVGSSVDGAGVTGSLTHSDSRGDAQDRWGSSEELSDTESERAAQASVRPPTKAPPAEMEPLVQVAQTPHHAVFTAAPPPQAPVSTSLWDDACVGKEPQGEAGSNGGSSLDLVSISRKNQMRRSQFFGLPVDSTAELPPPLQPVPLWSQTPPVPAPRARTIEPNPEDLRLAAMETERKREEEEERKRQEEEHRQKREQEERKREEEEEERKQKREQEERGWQGEEEEDDDDDDEEEERRQEEEARRQQQQQQQQQQVNEEEEEERRRQEEELRKRQMEQGRLRLEQEQEQRRQRAIEEARRRAAAAAEEEESRKREEEEEGKAAAAARKRREEEEERKRREEEEERKRREEEERKRNEVVKKERRRQEEQAAVAATAGARGSARAWTRVHTESDAGPQHKPVSVQRATGNMAQKLLEEANTQRLSALAPSGARPGPATAPPDPAVLDEERRQIVQQMKYPNPAARARGSLVFKEPALAREEARTASQAEKERQRILQELKKPAVVTSDASWIRNRGKPGAAVGAVAAAVPVPRRADDEWKRSSGVEFRTKRSSTLGGDRSWIRHSLAMGEMEHDRASAIASELSHVRRQCDDMGLRPTDMTDGPGSWNRSSPVSPEPAPDRPASSKKQCWGCQSSVGKGAAMFIESLNVYFHLECFKCGVCGGGLTTMGSGVDVRLRSGRLHCHECFTRADNGLQPQA
ncbi:LIM domain only protein 7 [Lampetra fluviatilis]